MPEFLVIHDEIDQRYSNDAIGPGVRFWLHIRQGKGSNPAHGKKILKHINVINFLFFRQDISF